MERYSLIQIVKIYGASFFYDRLRKMFVDFLRSADFDAVREAINVTPTIFEVIGKTRDERYVYYINVVGCILRRNI